MLYKEWSIDSHRLAAIWKIEEPEAFFAERTGLNPDIKNDKRRIEHLAGRFLLTHLKHDFPLMQIKKDEHDKPRLSDDAYFFSISHSWPYVAVIIDPYEEVGIDIQTWHPRILNIQHKFLSVDEQAMFENDTRLTTMAWSAKEAVYKWYGRRGVDFIEHMPITFYDRMESNTDIIIYFKLSNPPMMVSVEALLDEAFTCAYVTKSQNWVIY